MSPPVYVPSDAARLVRDWLKTEFATRAATLKLGLGLSTGWTPDQAPELVVFDDGGRVVWPVCTRPVLRVTVWSNSRTLSREIAGTAMGLLLCKPVTGMSRVKPGTALIDGVDSHNNGQFASFTVNATARTSAL